MQDRHHAGRHRPGDVVRQVVDHDALGGGEVEQAGGVPEDPLARACACPPAGDDDGVEEAVPQLLGVVVAPASSTAARCACPPRAPGAPGRACRRPGRRGRPACRPSRPSARPGSRAGRARRPAPARTSPGRARRAPAGAPGSSPAGPSSAACSRSATARSPGEGVSGPAAAGSRRPTHPRITSLKCSKSTASVRAQWLMASSREAVRTPPQSTTRPRRRGRSAGAAVTRTG